MSFTQHIKQRLYPLSVLVFAIIFGVLIVANTSHSFAASTTPIPVPAVNINGITVGPGFVEASARQVVRTTANKVYVVAADDTACQGSGKGVIHIWKGTGAQSANPDVPTAFSEVDAAHRPASATSGDCSFSGGSVLFNPDLRLDSVGTIHMAYIDTSGNKLYYQTFSTSTDTWGTPALITTGAQGTSGGGWPRGGQVALSLDSNDVPQIAYATSGSSNTLRYVNKASGSWSAPVTVASGTNIMHPSMVTSLDGSLHLAWLNNSTATHSTILYSRYSSGSWSTAETVSAGDSLVLGNGDDDQGPSIATDAQNRPHVLFMDGVANGNDNYVRMRYRATSGTWTDNTPSGAAGASNPSGTWFAHTPQNYISNTGDDWVFLGHDVEISPGGYQYQTGGPGHNWSAYFTIEPRDKHNTTAGATGIDGSASIRFDPLRDNNTGIIDLLYFDENDGSGGVNHHATVFYKAVVIGDSSTPPGNLVGDFDKNGVVDQNDLETLKTNWYSTTSTAEDLNSDGIVNVLDFSIFLTHYTPTP